MKCKKTMIFVLALFFNVMYSVKYAHLFLLAYEGNREKLGQEIECLQKNKGYHAYKKIINEENTPEYSEPTNYAYMKQIIPHEHNYLTALEGAILKRDKEIIALLIENGARVTQKHLELLNKINKEYQEIDELLMKYTK